MRITPASELKARIAALQALMQEQELDAVLMLQSADLFYFTGSIQQGILYVPAAGEPIAAPVPPTSARKMPASPSEPRRL